MPIVGGPKVRPGWCPFLDCDCIHCSADAVCGGRLPTPEPHAGGVNDMRLCIKECDVEVVSNYQINDADIEWFRRVFDALQGKGDFAFQVRADP